MAGAPLGLTGPGVQHAAEHRCIRLPRRAIGLATRMPLGIRRWIGGGCDLFHRSIPAWPPADTRGHSLAVAEFPAAGSPAAEDLAAAAQSADGLIVFSADAADRLERHYGAAPDRIHQVPVGTDHWERDLAGLPPRRPS